MSDGYDRLCRCGHEQGNHRASIPHPCLGPTPGAGDCGRGCRAFVAMPENANVKLTRQQRNCLIVSAEQKAERISSSMWGRSVVTALERAGLLEKIGDTYGFYRITEKGRDVATFMVARR